MYFAAQMLKKITTEDDLEDRSTAELDALKHRDWVRRHGRVGQRDRGSYLT